jgi:putative transposase
MIQRGLKFEIKPTEEQKQKLNQTFGNVRKLWNLLVNNFNNYGTELYIKDYNEKIIKEQEGFEYMTFCSAAALQQKRIDFVQTTKQYFNKNRKNQLGRPQFKKKSSRQSYRLPIGKFDVINGYLNLEKIGLIEIKGNPNFSNKILKNVTISKESNGRYYASVLVEEEIELLPVMNKSVAIDLGIKSFITTSDGYQIDNPKYLRENQARLSKNQRDLSRKVKGSNRYEKQREKVSKIYKSIKNKSEYFLHNLSMAIIREYDCIYLEDLNIKGMLKNHKLARSISEVSWSKFIEYLTYKAKWFGRTIVKIDRYFASSKLCSNCNHKMEKLDLDIRGWTCPQCGQKHDRDLNAAINIFREGYQLLTGYSAESVEHRHGKEIKWFNEDSHHLSSLVKCLDFQ